MRDKPRILCVNPWIADFAAYNLWAEPLGLLYLAAVLKKAGACVEFLNCLRSRHEKNPPAIETGCSKYIRTVISKPGCLGFINRNYAMYGISEDECMQRLIEAEKPDAVLVTSIMTYWYPGVQAAIRVVRRVYGKSVPVILGGIYARLCPEHARAFSGADAVYSGELSAPLLKLIEDMTGKRFSHIPGSFDFKDLPLPLHELQEGAQNGAQFICVLTSRGCPFSCAYCASGLLARNFSRRSVSSVIQEIEYYTAVMGTNNVSFYDDALLMDAERHAMPLFEALAMRGETFALHFPNGIHARFLTPELARLLKAAGARTIRLGFETADEELQRITGGKTSTVEFECAVQNLREAGFERKEVGAYIMAGLPGQSVRDVEISIETVYRAGAAPHLSYYSPIPGTALWEDSVRASPYTLASEPLFHNKTVYITGSGSFSEDALHRLKSMALELRHAP